jgi:hypothetical protein
MRQLLPSFCIIVLTTITFIPDTVQACSPGPGLYFGKPTYIDPDLSRSQDSYDRRRNFHFLIEPYVKLVLNRELYVDEKHVNDIPHRRASATLEPVAYELYLKGATHFHEYEYSLALELFNQSLSATDTNSMWVREASTYMRARTQLCMSQDDWDGYMQDSDQISHDVVETARESYQNYLTHYPNGLYTESAREIRRRIFYLQGMNDSLDLALKEILIRAVDTAHVDSGKIRISRALMSELYNHLSGHANFGVDHPFVIGLSMLGEGDPSTDEIELLIARRSEFSKYPGLFEYLYCLGLYRLGQFEKVIEATSVDTSAVSPLAISRLLLRARSYSRLLQEEQSFATLLVMYKYQRDSYLESEIAIKAKKLKRLEWLFTKGAPSFSNASQAFIAAFGFANDEIETALKNVDIVNSKRQFLVRELAHRYLLSSRYQDCLHLLAAEHLIEFDSVLQIVKPLVKMPKNVEALANLGEYLFAHRIGPLTVWNIDGISYEIGYGLVETTRRCGSCFAINSNRDNYLAPIDLFRSVVNISRQTGKRSEAEAKALHYIVFARKPGREYSVSWQDRYENRIAHDECKAAFQRLHRLYKDSKWAKATPYYYQ